MSTASTMDTRNRLRGMVWLAAVRENRWPDRARAQAAAFYMVCAYVPMMCNVFAQATGHVGSDFLAFWGAGRLVMAGVPWQAYDLAAEWRAQWPSQTGQIVAFVNPPPYLLLTGPLGLMPFWMAWLAWALGGWAVWFAVCRRLLPDQPLVLLSAPVAYLAASHAQNGFVTGVLLVGGVGALSRGDRRGDMIGGVLFGALVIKPHLALMVPLWLIAGRRWRAVAAALASALTLCLLSLIVFGAQTWAAWPQSWQVSATLMAQPAGVFFYRMATPYALIRVLTDADTAIAGQVLITLAVARLLWRRTRLLGANAGTGALMLAATAIASPYLFSYDLPFLIQPLLWLVGIARARGWQPWEKLGIFALWVSPLATRAAALPLYANLMPLAGAALVWMIAVRLDAGQSTTSG